MDVHYTLNETLPDSFTPKYTDTPIEIPEGPVTLKVATYREGKPVGRIVALRREELVRRAGK